MSLRAKVTIIFAVVIVLGSGLLIFSAYQGRLSRGLEIDIQGPEKVSIGVPFEITVEVSNTSQNIFEDLRLSLSLPDGVAFLGSPPAKNVDLREFKTLSAGGVNQAIFKLIALDGENAFKRIEASANFLSGSLSSRFEKRQTFDLAIGSYGIALDIAAPQKVFSGESFDTEISYKNSSEIDFQDLKLKLEYPLTYTFIKSALPPDVGNNSWVLGGLRKGSENQFKITGQVIGPDGAFFDVKATIEASFLGQTYPISAKTATLSIATSPLSLRVFLNEDPEYIAKAGDILNYSMDFANNTDVGLRDVIIRAQLIGEMFDFPTLETFGSFRSTDNTLTWNASNIPELATLLPGESGAVRFSLRAKENYPIKRLSDKNFLLRVSGSIESPTVPHFVTADKTIGIAVLETKVSGLVAIDTRAFFRDASAGVANSGPWPPRVNNSTQYTIHWLITNYSTDIKEVEVRAFLGSNVRFVKIVKSGGSSEPTYNERTQEIVWNIDRVPATTGVATGPMEAIFQIEATPSSADVGKYLELIKDTRIKAIDDFTGFQLNNVDFGVTTRLPDDKTINPEQGIIQP